MRIVPYEFRYVYVLAHITENGCRRGGLALVVLDALVQPLQLFTMLQHRILYWSEPVL